MAVGLRQSVAHLLPVKSIQPLQQVRASGVGILHAANVASPFGVRREGSDRLGVFYESERKVRAEDVGHTISVARSA